MNSSLRSTDAIAAIVANVDKQYIVAKCMDYIRYVNKTSPHGITVDCNSF